MPLAKRHTCPGPPLSRCTSNPTEQKLSSLAVVLTIQKLTQRLAMPEFKML